MGLAASLQCWWQWAEVLAGSVVLGTAHAVLCSVQTRVVSGTVLPVKPKVKGDRKIPKFFLFSTSQSVSINFFIVSIGANKQLFFFCRKFRILSSFADNGMFFGKALISNNQSGYKAVQTGSP